MMMRNQPFWVLGIFRIVGAALALAGVAVLITRFGSTVYFETIPIAMVWVGLGCIVMVSVTSFVTPGMYRVRQIDGQDGLGALMRLFFGRYGLRYQLLAAGLICTLAGWILSLFN